MCWQVVPSGDVQQTGFRKSNEANLRYRIPAFFLHHVDFICPRISLLHLPCKGLDASRGADACIYQILSLSLLAWSAAQSHAPSHSPTALESIPTRSKSQAHRSKSLASCSVLLLPFIPPESAESSRHPVVTLPDWRHWP
jgi:hypothetical protein